MITQVGVTAGKGSNAHITGLSAKLELAPQRARDMNMAGRDAGNAAVRGWKWARAGCQERSVFVSCFAIGLRAWGRRCVVSSGILSLLQDILTEPQPLDGP